MNGITYSLGILLQFIASLMINNGKDILYSHMMNLVYIQNLGCLISYTYFGVMSKLIGYKN